MPFLAPMIRAVVRGVFDHSNAYRAQLARAPKRDSRFALMPRGASSLQSVRPNGMFVSSNESPLDFYSSFDRQTLVPVDAPYSPYGGMLVKPALR